MNKRPMTAVALALAAVALAVLTGCGEPKAGGRCDPKTDSSFLHTWTDKSGHARSLRLECEPVGFDTTGRGRVRWEWVKK